MKGMIALGEKTETIIFTEFVQANGAIRAIFQASDRAVSEDRKSVDESLFHSWVVEMEELLQLAMDSTYTCSSTSMRNGRRTWQQLMAASLISCITTT
jgi:hypothetical protein